MTRTPERLTIDPAGVVTGLGSGTRQLPAALQMLVAQEVDGRTLGETNVRVEELMDLFGFGFEAWAEPGHVRMQPLAARMHAAAEEHARQSIYNLTGDLELPFDEVSGVLIVDTNCSELTGYLDLIHADTSLYGAEPYALAGSRVGLILRQTSCLQKYSIAADWDWESTVLPRCLFEISDSFRDEPESLLERLFRVRRFRLPEAHLHQIGLERALATAREVHRIISGSVCDLDAEYVVLVSVSHETWARHQKPIAKMFADSQTWALVLVSPPGALCQDGIELDFEYKILDSQGFPRELATFQIDTLITSTVGLSSGHGELTTTHLVPTGSVERLVYAHLDRVARLEQLGGRPLLPEWLTPVSARFLTTPGISGDLGAIAAEATRRGLSVEIDDRPLPPEQMVADADSLLVPVTVTQSEGDRVGRLQVRAYDDQRFREWDAAEWLATFATQGVVTTGPLGSSPRLSSRPSRRPTPVTIRPII